MMLKSIEPFFGRTEKDKMTIFGRRDNMLGIFILIAGLFCCLAGVDSKLLRTDTTLDPMEEGVCNVTKYIKKNVTTTVRYVVAKPEAYKSCPLWWAWLVGCTAKTRIVYQTLYKLQNRTTTSPGLTYSCCEGYVQDFNVCVPDCTNTTINCTKNCTNCSNDHSYCNKVTGVCHCKPGYYNPHSDCVACPHDKYGQNCTHRCQCQGNCDPQSGRCICETEKIGATCNDPEISKTESGTGQHTNTNNAGRGQHTNTNNAGSNVVIPVVCVLGVLIIAMVIMGVMYYRKRKMVKREETVRSGRVHAAYSPDGGPRTVLPSSNVMSNCYMRENEIYSAGDDVDMVELEYDKLNFQGHFKKLGHGQGQDIYSNPKSETNSDRMVENDLYSMD